MRVVLDTHVLIAAFIARGVCSVNLLTLYDPQNLQNMKSPDRENPPDRRRSR
jgi:predicted nucleic acid-binding protein